MARAKKRLFVGLLACACALMCAVDATSIAAERIYGNGGTVPGTASHGKVGADHARPANAFDEADFDDGETMGTLLVNMDKYAKHKVSLVALVNALRAKKLEGTATPAYKHVLVVGGGPVGMVAGLNAFAFGSTVEIAEKRTGDFTRLNLLGPRSAVHGTVRGMFEHIIAEARHAGVTVEGVKVSRSAWRAEVTWFFNHFLADSELDLFGSLPILSLESVLHKLISHFDTNLITYTRGADKSNTALQTLAAKAELVVGADGLWSEVRKAIDHSNEVFVCLPSTVDLSTINDADAYAKHVNLYLSLFMGKQSGASRTLSTALKTRCGLKDTVRAQLGGGLQQVMGIFNGRPADDVLDNVHHIVDALCETETNKIAVVSPNTCSQSDVVHALLAASYFPPPVDVDADEDAAFRKTWAPKGLSLLATPAIVSPVVAVELDNEPVGEPTCNPFFSCCHHHSDGCYASVRKRHALLLGDSVVAPYFPAGTGLRFIFGGDPSTIDPNKEVTYANSQFGKFVEVLKTGSTAKYKVSDEWKKGLTANVGANWSEKKFKTVDVKAALEKVQAWCGK